MSPDEYLGADATPEDLEAIRNFMEFLADPHSRCPQCLGDDHRYSQCPDVSDEERRHFGMMQLDVMVWRQCERAKVRPVTVARTREGLL